MVARISELSTGGGGGGADGEGLQGNGGVGRGSSGGGSAGGSDGGDPGVGGGNNGSGGCGGGGCGSAAAMRGAPGWAATNRTRGAVRPVRQPKQIAPRLSRAAGGLGSIPPFVSYASLSLAKRWWRRRATKRAIRARASDSTSARAIDAVTSTELTAASAVKDGIVDSASSDASAASSAILGHTTGAGRRRGASLEGG